MEKVNINKGLSIKDCLDNDVCFGHLSRRWNPNMKDYILTTKNKTHIINVPKTIDKVEIACKFVDTIVSKGGKILFVATKKAFKNYIKNVAKDLRMPYVTEKWFGGMLTNIVTVRKMVKRIENVNKLIDSPSFKFLAKKERLVIQRNLDKKKIVLDGVIGLYRMPDALFVIDVNKEIIAVREARQCGVPVVAIVDTNVDPSLVDYPIPANDDSLKSIMLITNEIQQHIEAALQKRINATDTVNIEGAENTGAKVTAENKVLVKSVQAKSNSTVLKKNSHQTSVLKKK